MLQGYEHLSQLDSIPAVFAKDLPKQAIFEENET